MIKTKSQGNSSNPTQITNDAVLVRRNIAKIDEDLYEYDEYKYTHEEYIRELMEHNETINNQLLNAELALVEIYEMVVK